MGRVLERYEMRRGSTEPLIRAMVRAATYAQKSGKAATIHYHYGPDPARSSGALTVEGWPARNADTYDTLVMEVAPGSLPGEPPYPDAGMVRDARETILRLYRRLYYRGYGRARRNDPELAGEWRARHNEYNRRYRQRLAGSGGVAA